MPRRSTELTRTLFPLAAVLVAGMWLGVYLSGRPLAPAQDHTRTATTRLQS